MWATAKKQSKEMDSTLESPEKKVALQAPWF